MIMIMMMMMMMMMTLQKAGERGAVLHLECAVYVCSWRWPTELFEAQVS